MVEMSSLRALKGVDIRTVDPASLIDIRHVHINNDLPKRERMLEYIRQIGNPYCYKCGDIIVKVGYASTDMTFDDRMENYLGTVWRLH